MKKYSLIRISTGKCLYGKRNVPLPANALPVPGLDPDLKWLEMQYSSYPVIDSATQGMTFKEELIGDKFVVTYFPYTITDGKPVPVTIGRGV
jgi:hypothetical protein